MQQKDTLSSKNNSVENYNVIYREYRNTSSQYRRPLRVRKLFWLINIVIIICITLYGNNYAKSHSNNLVENIYVTSCFLAGSLAVCGIWSLFQKIYFCIAKNSIKKLLPRLIKQQEEMLNIKYSIIDNIERDKAKPLVRPYEQCPYPSQLKNRWKEQEKLLHDLNLLDYLDIPSKLHTTSILWFVASFAVVVTVLLVIITAYLLIALLEIVAFLGILAVYFFRNEDPRMHYFSTAKEPPTPPKSIDVPQQNVGPKESTSRKIKNAKKEASQSIQKAKKDLMQWGYKLPGIQ